MNIFVGDRHQTRPDPGHYSAEPRLLRDQCVKIYNWKLPYTFWLRLLSTMRMTQKMSWPTWGIYLVGPCIQWYKKRPKKDRAWFRPLPRACTPWRRPASSRSDCHLYHLQSFVLSTEGWFLNIGTTAGTGFCWHCLVNNLTPSSFAADTKPEVFKFGQQLFIVMPFKGLFLIVSTVGVETQCWP